MLIFKIKIPGKCFLVGEYLALNGGAAIVFTNKPMFELQAILKKNAGRDNFIENQNPFHSQSPAGRFFLANESKFSCYQFLWTDPYFGKGGWGASSAQFLALHYLFQHQQEQEKRQDQAMKGDFHLMLNDYRSFSSGRGLPPSGADLIAQAKGGVCYFDRLNGKIQKFSWPFLDIGLAVIPTGKKLPTHEHLQSLQSIQTESLEESVRKVFKSLQTVNSIDFVEGISNFSKILKQNDWVADPTLEILNYLKKCSGVLSAKGCGALGADMVLVVYKKENGVLENIKNYLADIKLSVVCTEMDISDGPEIECCYEV